MHRTKIAKKIFALMLAQAITFSMIFQGVSSSVQVYAAENKQLSQMQEQKDSKTGKDQKIDKEEVVYVITDGEGAVDHIIVSDKLANSDNMAELLDKTDLEDIENMKGDESFHKNGDDTLTWDADGNAISYQGESQKELPVDVKISYLLDGKAISAEELAGKSGKVTIRFDYENKAKRKIQIDKNEYEVYVPFTMVSGMILDSDKFSNVQVENGKTLTEGDKIIAFGYAFPGLKESLSMEEGLLEDANITFPEYVEVTADVKDFSLNMTMTAVTNDLLNDLTAEENGDSDLGKDMDDLESATDEIIDGVKELKDGTKKAYDGSKKISDNLKKLGKGAGTLENAIGLYTDGVSQLNAGIPGLTSGVTVLHQGASQLATGAGNLETGVKDYVDGVNALAGALTGDGTAENPGYLNGVASLSAGAKSLSALSGLGNVSGAITMMSKATSSEETYETADGSKQQTLGYGAAALEAGLGQVIEGAKEINESTQADALKQLANGLSNASTMMKKVEEKSHKAAEECESAQKTMKAASDEIDSQAEKVKEAKQTLAEKEASINQVIGTKNETISSKNKELTDNQKKTNEEINTSIQKTIDELKTAKKALKDAETEEVKFTDQMNEIDKQIHALEGKKSPVKVTEDAISKIESAELHLESIDDREISDARLKDYEKDLDAISLKEMNMSQENAAIDQIAQSISKASDGMGTDPMGTMIDHLTQIQAGATNLKNGINQLHGNLENLEKATESFPAAAQGITALNQGFDTLTQNNAILQAGAAKLMENGSTLTAGASNLATGATQLDAGLGKLDEGSQTLSKGAQTLAKNNESLKNGSKALTSGADLLAKGSDSLVDGMEQLLDGTEALKEGMDEYKEEGIQKILDLYHDDIVGMKDRFDALRQAGREYQTYTQLADGETGNVKFIFKSGEIK